MCLLTLAPAFAAEAAFSPVIAPLFSPPAEFTGQYGNYRSLLQAVDGGKITNPNDWARQRRTLQSEWEKALGSWPTLLEKPRIQILSKTNRETFLQQHIRLETAPGQMTEGYLLIPSGRGPFPGVVVPYYEPESSIGQGKAKLRDFAYQLTRRGFISLSIGSPGGDARKPDLAGAHCQPLYFLAYVAANCYHALAGLPKVDPQRIAIVGHSYGGKWAMFGACFYEKFACGVWSDPGIVFDEARSNVNYWEPWYLGLDAAQTRSPGLITERSPRTGAYKQLYESGHDLTEVLALMAPRPFLVSGGAEDQPERWTALNRINEIYQLLGATNRVAMSTRSGHDPTPESNEQIYRFLEQFLTR